MTKIIENIIPFKRKQKLFDQLIFTPGIWINGKTYWIKNKNEIFLISEGISVKVLQKSKHSKVNYFDIFVTNHSKQDKQVKLLMMYHHYNQRKEQVSFISPVENVIYHISGGMVYLVNGMYNGNGFNHYTIQPKWNISSNIFWECPKKGKLNYLPMLKGSIASIYTFDMNISARDVQKCSSWSILGNNKYEISELNNRLLKTY
ncbi:hypothetical protein [Niallia sp. Krafla_26]|uniref:hypothetical protein n=1 Tax=Niallia sp. Krafla_26 TaxID=3064703 RepID=UPI003D166AE4